MYKAKNVDTEKALARMEELFAFADKERTRKIAEAERYHDGFCAGVRMAEEIFLCSNYEKDGGPA